MRKFMLLGILTILFPFALSAQNIKVSGKVLDANTNEALVGVTVIQTGTQNGTITDIDGNYSIDVPGDASLTFSYIGYENQTIFVNGKSTIVCNLSTNDKELDVVVVVGYGVQRKSDLTGSVAQVDGNDMKNRSTSDAAAALQGKAAGVQILTNSGAPGTGASIRVRGMSSNSGNNGPLLIVDGLKVDNIQYLDPEMIQSMEVLKDAASAAIYGAEAGNGVVLITTKNGGKSKDGTIFYNGQWTLSSLSRDLDVLNRDKYIDFLDKIGYADMDALKNQYGYNGTDEYNWQDEVFESTWNSRHTIGFQGGNDRGSYFLALNHVSTDGIFKGDKDKYKRLSLQVNGDYKIKSWLTVGTNNSFEKWETKSLSQQNDNGSALLGVITTDPLFGPYVDSFDKLNSKQQETINNGGRVLKDEDGRWYQLSPITGETQSGNPLIRRDAEITPKEGINLRGTTYLNFNPIKGLTYTSRFGYRVAQSQETEYEFPFYANSFVAKSDYRLKNTNNSSYYYQWENFVNYTKTVADKHTFGAMVGMAWEVNHSNNLSVEAKGNGGNNIFKGETDNYHYMDYVLDDVKKTANNAPSDSKHLSYYGRLTYNYDNRYNLQFNYRADAFDSSKLPEDTRWGKFPSSSAGWTISNESFFKDNISTSAVSSLKIRGSWGKNGNINVLYGYPYASTMKLNDMWYQYEGNSNRYYGSVPNGMPNPDLTWETSVQTDLGIDARFLDSRLSLGIDWYKKTTEDLLVTIKPRLETGIGSTTINAGDVENTGIEFELGWKDKIGSDFNYSINANLSTNKNEMTYLTPLVNYITGSSIQGSGIQTRCSEGLPLYYFYGYKTNGLNSDGSANIVDVNGDGQITEDDKTEIGNGLPKVTYGLTINLDYKGFDFLIFGTGVAGNDIVTTVWRVDRPYSNNFAWFYDNAGTKYPTIDINNWNDNVVSSDMQVFDGSYFKFKQIQLGYTIPSNITKKAKISNLRVYASLENFFTITKYIGLDPETASANSAEKMGLDFISYPTAKSVMFGVNLTF